MSGISDKDKLLEFWLESAEKDFQTMLDLQLTGHKHSFYLLCTDDFTNHWIEKIKECKQWIKSLL